MSVGWDEGIGGIRILKKKPSGVGPRGFHENHRLFRCADALSTGYGPPTEIQKALIPTPSSKYPRAFTVTPFTTSVSESLSCPDDTALSYTASVRDGCGNTTLSGGRFNSRVSSNVHQFVAIPDTTSPWRTSSKERMISSAARSSPENVPIAFTFVKSRSAAVPFAVPTSFTSRPSSGSRKDHIVVPS